MTERTGRYFLDQSEAILLARQCFGDVGDGLKAIAEAMDRVGATLTKDETLAHYNVADGLMDVAEAIRALASAVGDRK
jgi:hypothetical protein